MFELVILTRNGKRYSAVVRDWRGANAELSRFANSYPKNHPNDAIINACVLNQQGDRVSRYNRGQLEIFN